MMEMLGCIVWRNVHEVRAGQSREKQSKKVRGTRQPRSLATHISRKEERDTRM